MAIKFFEYHIKEVTPYGSEAELIETVMSNLSIFLPQSKGAYIAVREHIVGSGKVDVVLADTHPDLLAQRLASIISQNRLLPTITALVLSHLHFKKALRSETLSRRCGLPINSVTDVLQDLMESGLCSRHGNSTFVRTKLSRHFTEIVSIEGKLQDWRTALKQAYRNKLFSNFTYVVLDARHSRPAINRMKEFSAAGIGLAIAYADSNTVEIVQRPAFNRPISPVFYEIVQETMTDSVKQHKAHLSKETRNVLYHL